MSDSEQFQFPECWNDDIRMDALFAPFRSKSLNPNDFESKIKFWSNLIDRWCKHHKSPVINISSLKNNFCRKKLHPACLDEVFRNLLSARTLTLKDSIMTPDQSWSWALTSLVLKPFQKTFSIIKNTISNSNQSEVDYIHLPTLKFLGEELIKSTSQKEGLVELKELMKELGYRNTDDLLLILHWLQNQGLVAIHQGNKGILVKIAKRGEKAVKVTQKDLVMFDLVENEKVLEGNLKRLEYELNKAMEEIKRHLANKMKNMALISLQRKKKIEKEMERSAMLLENIREMQHQLDQVQLNAQVMECYKQGVATLKEILKDKNLSKETVEETMDELSAVLALGSDIENALAQSVESPSADESLEAELEEILLAAAPQVPQDELPRSPTRNADAGKALESKMKALAL